MNLTRAIVETQLTDKQKQMMIMKYVEGKKNNQIAKELGVTEPYVSRTLKKARTKTNNIKRIFKGILFK